jgi:hypothetical protein
MALIFINMENDIALEVLNGEFSLNEASQDDAQVHDRGFFRSSIDGAVNYLSISNFYWGEMSFGARIMNWNWREYRERRNGSCPFNGGGNPYGFILGGVSALGTEIGVLGYIVNSTGLSWKEVLLGDLALKTVPRFVDWMIVETYKKEGRKRGRLLVGDFFTKWR